MCLHSMLRDSFSKHKVVMSSHQKQIASKKTTYKKQKKTKHNNIRNVCIAYNKWRCRKLNLFEGFCFICVRSFVDLFTIICHSNSNLFTSGYIILAWLSLPYRIVWLLLLVIFFCSNEPVLKYSLTIICR